MADSKVRVEVETTANVSGLKQVQTEIKGVETEVVKLSTLQQALKDQGIELVGSQWKTVKQEVEQVAASTGKASTQAKSLGDAFGKVSMTKAVGEATTLARELATGSFNARTLGAFLGALGASATIGAVAGFAILGVVDKINEAILDAVKKMRDLNEEFLKSQDRLLHMAETARDLTDAVKMGDAVKVELDKSTIYVDQFRRTHMAAWKQWADEVAKLLGGFAGAGAPIFEPKRAKEEADAIDKMQERTRTLNVEVNETNDSINEWADSLRQVSEGEGATAIDKMEDKVRVLREQLEAADFDRALNPSDPSILANYLKIQGRLEDAVTKTQNLKKEQDQYTQAVETSERVWDRMPAQIQQAINALDKMIDHQMKADAAIWQRGLDITQQMKDRAGIARDTGDIERVNADKVQKTYDDALRTAQELKLTSGQRVYTDQEAAAKALEASDAVRVGLAKELDKKRADILEKYQSENRINLATGNDELVIAEKLKKVKEETIRTMEKQGFSPDEINRQVDLNVQAERQHLETLRGTGAAQSTLNVEMKEYETILQNIRQQQTVLKDQAFIGVDQQNVQMVRLYREEIVNIINAMQQQQARKATLTDPAEIAKANQELQKFAAQYQVLAAKIVTTTHQFQAGLQSWANSFGSTGQQLANTLQQTVGAALQSFNQWVVTGKFNLQALLQNVIQLGLQLVEQLLIQRAVGLINASLAETQAVASAQIIAAAWAGAATAVTTATEGQAAYGAPAALAIGLAGVKGVLGIGSLHEGGPVQRMHSGGLAHDEVPIIAQEGEIMIRRSVAQRDGMADFLLGLNAGEFHDGGFVAGGRYHRGSGGGGDHIVSGGTFSDMAGFELGNPREMLWFANMFAGFGTFPSTGIPAFGGSTMIPTTWVNYPGVGLVPMATGPDTNLQGVGRTHNLRSTQHTGGMISRMHSGGGVSGRGGGGGVHIYAFTDLKQLVRHMGSKDGQKIIFDTVKGRRIDLGIS